jgi:outer membrane protein
MNRNWIPAFVAACLAAGTAGAEDLQAVFDHALVADPTMQQASMLHMATREVRTQALLAMLPLNAAVSKNWTGGSPVTTNPVTGFTTGGTYSMPTLGTVGLQVNLFSWNNWIALKQSNATVAQGEANYLAAQEDLVQRVSSLYFAVLAASDTLAAQESALQSVQRQLEQAERRFEVGLIAITDVQIARAARDSQSAAVIAARRTKQNAEENLRAVTGEKYQALSRPSDNMPLLTPDPASEDTWVSTALSQNAALTASRMAAEISRDSYLSAFGGHLPTITASASRNWDLQNSSATSVQSATGGSVNTSDVLWSVGISVPIFSAGATQSKVRQANYTWKAAQAGYEKSLRQTEQLARDAYQGVISQIAQVGALRQAVESNTISLQATEAGYEVGTKTAIDVLTARQNLVNAQTSYAQARYSYLNNIVNLRLAAGNLDVATIKQINGWLVDAAPSGAPPVPPVPAAPAGSGGPAAPPTGG